VVTEATTLLISDDEMRIVVQAVTRSSDQQAVYEIGEGYTSKRRTCVHVFVRHCATQCSVLY